MRADIRDSLRQIQDASHYVCRGLGHLADEDGANLDRELEEAEHAIAELLENVRTLRTNLPTGGAL